MKNIAMLLVMLGSVNANASFGQQFKCECQDTGLECEGMQKMTITLEKAALAYATFADRSGHESDLDIDSRIDPTYRPKKYKEYSRFIVTNEQKESFPYLLIENFILEYGRVGNVKVIEKNKYGYAHTWEFECKYSRQVPLREIKGGIAR